jgi:hypothetical protein
MTLMLRGARLAAAAMVLLASTAACAGDPAGQIGAATNSAITTSLRGLPGVTAATVTETTGPPDTLVISMATGLDQSSPDDSASATALLREAADMAYATRHNTLDAVSVTVYGVGSNAAAAEPTAVLAQSTFKATDLATGKR